VAANHFPQPQWGREKNLYALPHLPLCRAEGVVTWWQRGRSSNVERGDGERPLNRRRGTEKRVGMGPKINQYVDCAMSAIVLCELTFP